MNYNLRLFDSISDVSGRYNGNNKGCLQCNPVYSCNDYRLHQVTGQPIIYEAARACESLGITGLQRRVQSSSISLQEHMDKQWVRL